MRTFLRGKVTLLFMALGMLLAVPAVAYAAELVVNAELNSTTVTSVTVKQGETANFDIKVSASGNVACGSSHSATVAKDFSLDDQATLSVDANSAPLLFPSGGTATTGNCPVLGGPYTVAGSITADANTPVGTYTDKIILSETQGTTNTTDSNTTGAKLDDTTATKITVVVQKADPPPPPANNAPDVSVTGVTDGANYDKGSVPAAGCSVTDTEDGLSASTTAASPDVDSSQLDSDGLGSETVSCSYTDGGGLAGNDSVTYTIGDPTGPSIDYTLDPASPDGANGWYKGDVKLDWTVTDDESPTSLQTMGCDDQNIVADQQETTYTCSARSAGGSADPVEVKIKRDGTAPAVGPSGSESGTLGNNGWYTSAVTQQFAARDATSGLPASFTTPFTRSSLTDEGDSVNINSGPVTDNAGNTNGGVNAGPFKIDLSDPEANCDSAPSGWSGSDVSISCQGSDAVSDLADPADANFSLTTNVANGTETASAQTGTHTVYDNAGRSVTAGPVSSIKVDKKAPVLSDNGATTSPNGTNNWYTSAVTNSWTATDGGSGFAPSGALTKAITQSSGTNEGGAVQIASGAVSDAVGNPAPSVNSATFKIDLSDPTNVQFSGGPAAGSSHYFGSVPAAPTCSADDAISGLKDCVVTGYSTAVGTHTMTATATDNAGRTNTATRSYTVKSWTTAGFYQPVDMSTGTTIVWNTVKGGSTVPLKFELFAGSELTDPANVKSLQSQKVSCSIGTGTEDAIETTATGGTSLRYDSTGGQFVYNWKTPTGAGTCYKATVTAQDESTISAYFKMK